MSRAKRVRIELHKKASAEAQPHAPLCLIRKAAPAGRSRRDEGYFPGARLRKHSKTKGCTKNPAAGPKIFSVSAGKYPIGTPLMAVWLGQMPTSSSASASMKARHGGAEVVATGAVLTEGYRFIAKQGISRFHCLGALADRPDRGGNCGYDYPELDHQPRLILPVRMSIMASSRHAHATEVSRILHAAAESRMEFDSREADPIVWILPRPAHALDRVARRKRETVYQVSHRHRLSAVADRSVLV